MDQIKIGKFIVECRKAQKLTQEQLASKLGISNRSVSNWENGICLPDSSLYKPLCDILDISLNEFFEGQKLEFQNTANENLINMLTNKLYQLSDKSIPFDEFKNALIRMSEVTTLLQSFKTKEEAIDYMMIHTQTSYEECAKAYDFYINLFEMK